MSSSKTADNTATASTEGALSTPGEPPRFEPYELPAGGWGALQAVAKALREQGIVLKGGKTLLSMNQPDGFDCPGCAWPDPKYTSSFEFCANDVKALTFEATSHCATGDFFAAHTVRELARHNDYWLEEQGRLIEPMHYDAASDHYAPIAWEEAFALIGRELRALASLDFHGT
jgi:anaerobic selenocysteine-containing dehydrogenase